MNRDEIPPTVGDEAPRSHESASLGEELRALLAAAKAAFDTEFAFQTARASLVGKIMVRMALLALLVLALLFFVLMALVVGLLLALAPLLTPWGALAAVVIGLLAFTLLAGLGVKSGLRRLKRVLGRGGSA